MTSRNNITGTTVSGAEKITLLSASEIKRCLALNHIKDGWGSILDDLERAKAKRLQKVLEYATPAQASWAHQNLRAAYAHKHYCANVWLFCTTQQPSHDLTVLDDEFRSVRYDCFKYSVDAWQDYPPTYSVFQASAEGETVYGVCYTVVAYGGMGELIKVLQFLAGLELASGVVIARLGDTEFLYPTRNSFPADFLLPEIALPTLVHVYSDDYRHDRIHQYRECLSKYEVRHEHFN